MSSNVNNNTDFFGFTDPVEDGNSPHSNGQGFTNTNSNSNPNPNHNTAHGPVFFGPPPPPSHVFHNNDATTAPSIFGQYGQAFQSGNIPAAPSYFGPPAIPQTPTFPSNPGHGPVSLGQFGHNFNSGNNYLTASYLETPSLPASATFAPTPGPSQTHFGQAGPTLQSGNMTISPSYDYIESPEFESPPTFPAQVFFGPPPPPPLPAMNTLPQHNLVNNPQPPSIGEFAHVNHWALPHLVIGSQNAPAQGPQHAPNPVEGFGGLNIQGASVQPEDESEDEDMDMDPSAEGLDFGNSDEDYSEDSDFEYDYVDENDNPVPASKLPKNAAMKAMMTSNRVRDAAMPDTDAGDLDHDDDFPEIEEIEHADDEEDSDWEDDPTGYQDPADPRAAAFSGPSTSTAHPVPATVPSFTSITTNPLTSLGILPTTTQLTQSLKRARSPSPTPSFEQSPAPTSPLLSTKKPRLTPSTHSPLEALASHPELYFELCAHLLPSSLLTLYATSRLFHATLNTHLTHALKTCARAFAPLAGRICRHGMYDSLCIFDPSGRRELTNWALVRRVPSFRWLAMVVHRERCVRDILACLAREGHRLPKSMGETLVKTWVVMDVATTAGRICLVHNETWWTDVDCWNVQAWVLKLGMRFNEPMTGIGDDGLVRVMLGQRGLTPLWRLLMRRGFTTAVEVLRAAVRYCYEVRPENCGMSIFGVPPAEIGQLHLEGWGAGKIHLFRIDELVMRESVRRRLRLDDHLLYMMLWGHVDPVTGRDIRPTDEEMYMSDTEDEDRAIGARIRAEQKKESAERKAERARMRRERAKVGFGGGDTEMGEEGDEEGGSCRMDKGKGREMPEVESDTTDYSTDLEDNVDEWRGIEIDDETAWETEDEDMAEASLFNDLRDAGAVGPSGWRRKRGSESESESSGDEGDDEEDGDGGDDWDD
ncbi:hypothetical protein VC83_08836 [Pseudogymnoascus destructans]|uniref:Uncharacterized protein n=2 Tax=Pseudogymnoascus destructans TaxID=655981 RepID=L8FPS9_PSED2|nr:uncharacterized protein VC83_08836 [Pseudogymnoascus destructans]ELR02529.1 hypothetical protein GMDG_01054 [Pseudogymnoascus destructans 20631-21]OAF54652.1 hypothetical protein VC83_08836 [Pseudogymnoascus destructans]